MWFAHNSHYCNLNKFQMKKYTLKTVLYMSYKHTPLAVLIGLALSFGNNMFL